MNGKSIRMHSTNNIWQLKLAVQQTVKACDDIADNMIAYRDLYNTLEGDFDDCELRHIGRESNEEADILANIGSTKAQVPPGVFLERITHRLIHKMRSTANSKEATIGSTPSTLYPTVEVL